MIRARLLCVVALLAGTACTATSAATDAPSQQGPVEVAAEQAPAGPGRETQEPEELLPEAPAGSLGAFREQLEQLRGRVDALQSVERQTLDEVQASFDGARGHAQAVFARIASLKIVLQEAGVGGAAPAELDALELDAEQLEESAAVLQEDLHSRRAALRELVLGVSALEAAVEELAAGAGADGPAADALPSDQLLALDEELVALQSSGAAQALVGRSDQLVNRVALLVSRVDRAERKLAAAAGPPDGGVEAEAVAAPVSRAGAPGDEADDAGLPRGEIAELRTNKGTLLLQFFPDVAPAHVQNFKRLVRDGFYDGLSFHRVLPGYIIQGGCPRGDGFGGPGWQLDNEFNRRPHRRGTLSMARFAHPDSAGSQFFICLDDRPELDGKQTVFGRVIRGEDTLRAIEALGDSDGDGTPSEPIIIEQVLLRPWQQGDDEASMIAGNPVR